MDQEPGCERSCDSPVRFCIRNWIKEPRRNDQNCFRVEQWVTLNGSAGNPPGLATTARRRVIALKGRYAEVVTRSNVRDENQGTWILGVCGSCHVLQHKRDARLAVARQRAETAGLLLCVTYVTSGRIRTSSRSGVGSKKTEQFCVLQRLCSKRFVCLNISRQVEWSVIGWSGVIFLVTGCLLLLEDI